MLRAHNLCRCPGACGEMVSRAVTRGADRVRGLAQFLRELRDFLNELDCGPLDWAVLGWKTELAIS